MSQNPKSLPLTPSQAHVGRGLPGATQPGRGKERDSRVGPAPGPARDSPKPGGLCPRSLPGVRGGASSPCIRCKQPGRVRPPSPGGSVSRGPCFWCVLVTAGAGRQLSPKVAAAATPRGRCSPGPALGVPAGSPSHSCLTPVLSPDADPSGRLSRPWGTCGAPGPRCSTAR